jgi:Tfp pilus assembly protein PilO
MFSKVLFGIIVAMGGVGYIYFQTTQGQIADLNAQLQTQAGVITAFETRQAEQVRTIEALQNNLQKTTEALNTMSTRNQEIEAEAQRYLAIFARHNLSKLAAAKPGLIETRINKGTSDVFRTIEQDTTDIDAIDDN